MSTPDPTDLAADAAEQLVEHVDADGRVIEIVTRADMRRRVLRHRSVYIAVLDPDDRLLVHKRADWKDVFPGAWDLAFGGVCDVGEAWADAAHRELWEEAGVRAELEDRGRVAYDGPDVSLVGNLYLARHDGPFRFDDGEVADSRWVPIGELATFVADHETPSDSRAIVTAASLTTQDQAGPGEAR